MRKTIKRRTRALFTTTREKIFEKIVRSYTPNKSPCPIVSATTENDQKSL